ncbi:hypothetical protein MtrunA17_Chr1g0209851 [Medicago truncatula]|uniref:Uncharacterized protein n=1 Tax=Medicago truncatula TaxID=3880 RepID=A0A396K0U0_MEDTR|nr:hypothetical protein MtrunA17_Chr1g0209851 [Medicago truncatula]
MKKIHFKFLGVFEQKNDRKRDEHTRLGHAPLAREAVFPLPHAPPVHSRGQKLHAAINRDPFSHYCSFIKLAV